MDAEGSVDVFTSVPSPTRILTAIFIDEWNLLVRAKAAMSIMLKLKLFGKIWHIPFKDLVVGSTDMYVSVGGTEQRIWCGETANPPGLFLSAKLIANPFQNVPILKDWIIESSHTAYVYVTTDPSSKISEDMKIDVTKDLIKTNEIVENFRNILRNSLTQFEYLFLNDSKEILRQVEVSLTNFYNSVRGYINSVPQSGMSEIASIFSEIWKQIIEIEGKITDILDKLEHFVHDISDDFITALKTELELVKRNINNAIQKLSSQIHAVVENISGIGIKYTASVIKLFGLKLFGVDIELVWSTGKLMECSRFEKVKNLLKGERAVRYIFRFSRETRELGFFLKTDYGLGGGFAVAIDTSDAVARINAYANIIGIKTTVDLFISRSGLHFYTEGNVWGIFLAQIDASAEVGKEWHQLNFNLQGRFLAKARRKRQSQTVSGSFQDSYLDGLKKVVRTISNEADKRISQAQRVLTDAQSGLSKAQNWLGQKQADLRKAHIAFDHAVAVFERAKDKLEEAKGPFEEALEKLRKAQKNVDNLCRIMSCKPICIPGVKCKICFGWIPYPCCSFTNCMLQIPNLLCEAANLLCRAVRAAAYLALEVAKIFVRIPMLALDVAKVAVSVAQFAVDKSRIVLVAAEGVLELAKLGLTAASGVLELAKLALEAVKLAIKAAAKVLEFVITYGLQNILDVKNCGFNIQLSTTDLPIFDVFCDVNAFRLGWKTIRLRVNFRNVLQTIWQAAKTTINTIIQVVFGRKRRDISFAASSQMHRFYRHVMSSQEDPMHATNYFLNDTIDIINMTVGFNSSISDDYNNRVSLFEQKCIRMNLVMGFLKEISGTLFELTNETKTALDEASNLSFNFHTDNMTEILNGMTIESANISSDYAFKDYNITKEDLEKTLNQAKESASDDPIFQNLSEENNLPKSIYDSELKSIEHSSLLENWILGMENRTKTHFSEKDCAEFRDCILYATSQLYDLYIEEDHLKLIEIQQAITDVEDTFINIIQNTSQHVIRIYNMSLFISSNLRLLEEENVFCSEPPRFLSPLENATVSKGHSVSLRCDAIANPSPRLWWLKNNDILTNQTNSILIIANATDDDQAMYQCMAGNLVANLTSNKAYVFITEGPEVVKATAKYDSELAVSDISCYITTIVYIGVVFMQVLLLIILIARKYGCVKFTSIRSFAFKVILPGAVIFIVGVTVQLLVVLVWEKQCSVVGGLLLPCLGMMLTNIVSSGVVAVVAKANGAFLEKSVPCEGSKTVDQKGQATGNILTMTNPEYVTVQDSSLF